MTETDKKMLDFADAFERGFVNQGTGRRGIGETLDTGIKIMEMFSLEVK